MCETELKIAYIKKHAYKNREETTHVKIGEENIHHIYIYIYIYLKDKHNVCKNGHKIGVQKAKRLKQQRGKCSP